MAAYSGPNERLLYQAAASDEPDEVRRLLTSGEFAYYEGVVTDAMHCAMHYGSWRSNAALRAYAAEKGWLGNSIEELIATAIRKKRAEDLRELMKTPANLAAKVISEAIEELMTTGNQIGDVELSEEDLDSHEKSLVHVFWAMKEMINPRRTVMMGNQDVPAPIAHKTMFDPEAIADATRLSRVNGWHRVWASIFDLSLVNTPIS